MKWRVRPVILILYGASEVNSTDHVPPQAVAGRDDQGVVHAAFDPFQRDCARRIVQVLHRQEFVVDPVVEHQQHVVGRRIVLDGEKAFRGVVSFDVFHPVGRDDLAVLLAVGFEVHTAVGEQFHVRPYLQDVVLAGIFEYFFQHHEIPRRDAGERGDVLRDGFPADRFDFPFEIGDQRRLGFRNPHPEAESRGILDQDGRQVAFLGRPSGIFEPVAAAERQRFARKYAAFRIAVGDHADDVHRTPQMAIPQTFAADRDEFAFRCGRSGRFGEPADVRGPRDVVLAAADTVDVAAERCVVRHGNPFAELTSVADLVETVFLSESGCGCLSQQFLQL